MDVNIKHTAIKSTDTALKTPTASSNASTDNHIHAFSTPTLAQIPSLEPSLQNDASTDAPTRTTLQTILIMLALCTATFLAALDTVILTTALPTIAADLRALSSGFAWVGSSFLLANAASMPFWGRASDVFGRRPLLLLANAVFMLGSVVSGAAPTLAALLAGRAVQGLGAGGLTVLVNIVVSDLFCLRRRGLMLALVGSVWSFASTIGPVMGGALAQKAGWRWCFWVNLPFNATSLLLLTTLLNIHTPHTPLLTGLAALDWLGGATLTTGTVALLLGLDLGGVSFAWTSGMILTLLILGVLLLTLFIIIEYHFAANPIMPLSRITRSRSNVATLLVCTSHGICYIAVAYFMPLYFQSILGLSPLQSGTWSLVTAGTLLLTSLSSGAYMHITGRYLEIIYFGLSFLVLGFGLFTTLPAPLDAPRIVAFQILMSLGVGSLFQPPLVALQAHLETRDVATGTATFGFVRMLAAGFSIVVGQAIFQGGMRSHSQILISSGIPADAAGKLIQDLDMPGERAGLTEAQRGVVRGIQSASLSRMWLFYAVVAGVGVLAGLGVRRREMSAVHVETKTGLGSLASTERSLTLHV